MQAFLRVLICVLAFGAPALAQTYPSKPVRLVVGFAPGGPSDMVARLVAPQLSEKLRQPVKVENIAGAGGMTASGQVAKAAPDGHTLAVVSTGFILNPALHAKALYDVRNFEPVSLVATAPNVLVVNAAVPAKTVRELADLMRAEPARYGLAHPGVGSTPHLSAELFKLTFSLSSRLASFSGAGPAIAATVAGEMPAAIVAVPAAMADIRSGKLRALAIMAEKRLESLPDVPTVAQAGLVGQDSETLIGIVAPFRTPKSVIETLAREIALATTQPDLGEKLKAVGFAPAGSTPAQFAQRIQTEVPVWERVIKGAGIRIDFTREDKTPSEAPEQKQKRPLFNGG